MTCHGRQITRAARRTALSCATLAVILLPASIAPAAASSGTAGASASAERVMVGALKGAARPFARQAERPRRLEPRRGVSVVRLKWRRWGSSRALGRGTARVACRRRCGARRVRRARGARVALSRLRPGICDGSRARFYTRARITYPKTVKTRRQRLRLQVGAAACSPPAVVPKGGPGDSQPAFPIRAAFYYPWFPETWEVNGSHVFYRPSPLGYYDSSGQAVADQHVRALDWARVEAAIASWWGLGTHKDETRIPLLLDRTRALGSPLKWSLYYECEGSGPPACPAGPDPPAAQIRKDLAAAGGYAAHPSFLRIGGRPVVFVYSAGDGGCELVERWREAAPDWYVVLKLFSGYRDCPTQPDRWHQYGPAAASSHHAGHSFSVSPGFWRADEASPRLDRDAVRFARDVRAMVASGEPFQLVTTFNEWGEGTAVEGGVEWGSASGYGRYLDLLRSDGHP